MDELFYQGRPGDPRIGSLVKRWEGNPNISEGISEKLDCVAIVGSPDDLGVKLNGGRPGAAQGPDTIRKHLYKMTPPLDGRWNRLQLFDAGNIKVTLDILETHKNAKAGVSKLAAHAKAIIALGGGHDFGAPHFIGFVDGWQKRGGRLPRPGLINVDPHLDVRELENNRPHSGTPFREILGSKCLRGENLIQFGYRRNRNAQAHLDFCREREVVLMPYEKLGRTSFAVALTRLSQRCSVIGLTIDMDSCKDAEGTSAAPVIGFSAEELCRFAEIAGANPKVNFLEIAEVAPRLDTNDRSARIAAEIIYAFLCGRAMQGEATKQLSGIRSHHFFRRSRR